MPSISSCTYLGIDPGRNGGIILLQGKGGIHTNKMPSTDKDIWDLINLPSCTECFAAIEKVGGYVGKKQPGSAMFKFGMSYGGLKMALTAADIPFEEVVPQRWQKAMGVPPKKKTETNVQWKNRLKAKAQQLFPAVKVTLAIADALLIAEYCRRKQKGLL